MTLKRRIAINIAVAFSILFGLAAFIIFYSFSSFRREEFRQRLEEKALTTAKLLVEVKEIDNQILKLVDQNTINKLYNEKTLVFDQNFKLLYSSIDDATISWNVEDLKHLKREKSFFRSEGEKDVLGIYYDFEKADYYILLSAEDKYGINKLDFLLFTLVVTFLAGTILVWFSTYFFIERLLKPLDNFQKQITNISVNQLDIQLEETKHNDEINLLTKAFNIMLARIEKAFQNQREFTSNASHEIRTPLARITFKVQNLLQNPEHSPETITSLKSINDNVHQLSDLVNSLLLLSKFNKEDAQKRFEKIRIDEVIFSANEQIKKSNPQFFLNFEIIDHESLELSMEVYGVRSLLEIVFINLLKNACLYSTTPQAQITIEQTALHQLQIKISNQGDTLSTTEQEKLFQPFMRGQNANKANGSGLGLRLSKRILDYHSASIEYSIEEPNTNIFTIIFSN
ncbi:integral membrane sensor signal transduction histidine kinase [Emticicia oligotrophica DSM 17448]|uniref:histidine kinase n=1 Tax=Emticicia oligotrophica (strain DSM 17448 / CIP 109782 / MTCC 6937 / GPTSA100-15) TaxID=929562 RepID=A0ABM5MYZ0_EMTOG|nr:HAMP domain-containing sensor histidine kinase [Emticicia oligotrophica]AFK02357.1 integral membrane sensor signal transduction histidine kinase [Emticicia oligotrophica DSM 17448]